MLTNKQRKRLLDNWGILSDALRCNAEARLFDPLSKWECYIYALDPSDMNTIACVINGVDVEITTWTMSEIGTLFNAIGDGPENDMLFIPISITRLINKLRETA